MKLIRSREKKAATDTKPNSVRLEHDPIPNLGLTPIEKFNYPIDENTYEALRFLASWYNSDQYANMEHDRGRDNSISGRHILQTPYGESRVGERNAPYDRAVNLAYSDRLNYTEDLPKYTYGTYNPYDKSVKIDKHSKDKPSALVHELYHAAENATRAFAGDGNGGTEIVALDRRFAPDAGSIIAREVSKRFSNPYTPEQWSENMFGDGWKSQMQRYVSEPSEVTARLRQVIYEAQKEGLLSDDEFTLNDDILNKLKNKPSGSAEQLLEYFTPDQRKVFYENL